MTVDLDGIFKVEALNADGMKFDKVSRVGAHCEDLGLDMELDVNSEIYPVRSGEKYSIKLTEKLSQDGRSLVDDYDYIMHGMIYKIADRPKESKVQMEVYASFGGLLLLLSGDFLHLSQFKIDQKIFILMRKV